MVNGQGWTGDSRRHSLARKGISTQQERGNLEQSFHAKGMDRRIVVVDIDGAILDTSQRWKMAKREAVTSSKMFYDLLNDTSKVKYDEPIPNTAYFLNMLKQDQNVEIVYISTRRTNMMKETKKILENNEFPHGKIILRQKGMDSSEFKYDQLKELRDKYKLQLMITDEFRDVALAESLGVSPVKVGRNKEWSKDIRKKIVRLSTE